MLHRFYHTCADGPCDVCMQSSDSPPCGQRCRFIQMASPSTCLGVFAICGCSRSSSNYRTPSSRLAFASAIVVVFAIPPPSLCWSSEGSFQRGSRRYPPSGRRLVETFASEGVGTGCGQNCSALQLVLPNLAKSPSNVPVNPAPTFCHPASMSTNSRSPFQVISF